MIHKKSSNTGVRAELGRYPLSISIINSVISYYLNILNRSSGSFLQNAINIQRVILTKATKKSWLSVIQFVSIKLGWGTQMNPDNSEIKQNINIKTVLKDEYLKIAQELLHLDKKLNLYIKIKRNFGQEKYLSLILNPAHRRLLTMFRISAHNFPIETGRYSGICRDNRICPLCSTDIGDEKHYFLSCANVYLNNLRIEFKQQLLKINSSFNMLDDDSLFLYLIALHDNSVINFISNYIYNISEIFRENKKYECTVNLIPSVILCQTLV